MYLLLTDEGKALAISLWSTEETAEAGVVESRPVYEDQIERFTAIYRAAPARSRDVPRRAGRCAMRLELGGRAGCSDGTFGELADVMIDPTTRRVTHLVVTAQGEP
jgi:hypothetical protein